MTTTSELIVTATIWMLTAAGSFFCLRAAWRRRKQQRSCGGANGGVQHVTQNGRGQQR